MVDWEPGQKMLPSIEATEKRAIRNVSVLYLVGAAFGAALGDKQAAALFAGLGALGLALTTDPKAWKAWLARRRNSFARHKLGPDRL